MEEDDALKSLADLSGPNDKAARRALDRLRKAADRPLKSYLHRRFDARHASDFDDIIQEVFIKVWKKRGHFANQGYAAWYSYLQTIARRCFLDHLLPEQDRAALSYEEVSERELEVVFDFLNAIDQSTMLGSIHHAADALWLGLDAALPGDLHRRQVLAAKYFYLDGAPWEEVLDLLGPLPTDGAPLTRQRLDAWLEHEGVIRGMAFDELFYSKDRLTWFLLGLAEPVQTDRLDALVREACAPQGSNPTGEVALAPEVAVILWRYRIALHPDQIVKRSECVHSAEQLAAILDSFLIRFPFTKKITTLLSRIEPVLGARAAEVLQTPGLWKRLAFQYYYGEELSLSDIHDRLTSAAQRVGYPVNPGILNVWLSGRRLIVQLAHRVCDTRGERRL